VNKKWIVAGGIGVLGAAAMWSTRKADVYGQVVVITGGSRGLGLALAREFGELGCRLAICARDPEELERARKLLEDEGYEAFATTCDVTSLEKVQQMVDAVRQRYGRIDILVNNAGQILVAPVENTTLEDFGNAMNVMFWGVLHPTLAVLPEMMERGSGRIGTITSIGGKVSVPHLLSYSCAKAAATAFCEGLRAEVAQHGVSVTTIAPGLMRTGSAVQAKFKGKHHEEAAWFSTAASMPLLTISAERAARQAIDAIRQGRSERILSTNANVLARVHGAFPGLVPNVMALVNRLLPSADRSEPTAIHGKELAPRKGSPLHALTTLGRSAGARLNQGVV